MCDCIDVVNKNLEPYGGSLGVGFGVVGNTMVMRLLIQTTKKDTRKRKRLPIVYCHYCPFCGEKTEPATQAQAAPLAQQEPKP